MPERSKLTLSDFYTSAIEVIASEWSDIRSLALASCSAMPSLALASAMSGSMSIVFVKSAVAPAPSPVFQLGCAAPVEITGQPEHGYAERTWACRVFGLLRREAKIAAGMLACPEIET
jgi:hypothetical protein